MAGESGKSLLTLFNDNIHLPVESFWSHFSRFTRWCTYWWILSITTRDGRPSSTNYKSFGIFQLCCPVARPQCETDSTCMYVHVLFLFFFLSLSRFLYSRVIRFDGLPGRALRRDSRVLGERKTRCLEVLCSLIPWGNSAERFPARSITFEVDLLLMTIATVFLYIYMPPLVVCCSRRALAVHNSHQCRWRSGLRAVPAQCLFHVDSEMNT